MAIGTPVSIGSGSAESAGATATMTVSSAVSVGDHVLVAGGCDGAGRPLSSVTDSRGNTYQVDHHTNNMTASANPSFVASSKITTALQVGDTITATWGTSFFSTRTIAAVRVSGLASTSWLDQHAGGHTQFTGTDPTPTVVTPATTQADEIVWAAVYFNSGSAATPGATYTEVHDFAGSGGRRLADEYRIISATGTQTVTWTIPDVQSSIAVATYKAAAGGGDPEAHSGTASVSGGGAITVSGSKGAQGVGSVSGSGAVQASGLKAAAGAALVQGDGTVSSTGRKSIAASVSTSGGGSVSATGRKSITTTLSVSGGGSLIVAGYKSIRQSATVSGGGNSSATGRKAASTSVVVTGGGSVVVTGLAFGAGGGIVTVSGGGIITISGRKGASGSVDVSSGGSVSVAGATHRQGAASVSGGGQVTVVGFVPPDFGSPTVLTLLVYSPNTMALQSRVLNDLELEARQSNSLALEVTSLDLDY